MRHAGDRRQVLDDRHAWIDGKRAGREDEPDCSIELWAPKYIAPEPVRAIKTMMETIVGEL